MPSKFNSTAKKPGKAVKKAYNRGGRANLRDEEARVIGVQDNAADEMRRVKARRPNDAAERKDKRSQESRVGSRERNAREEMRRLRGEAAGMGMNKGGKTVKKFMGGGMDAGINASLGRMNSGVKKRVAAMPAPTRYPRRDATTGDMMTPYTGRAKGGQTTSPLTSQHKRYAMTGTTKLKTGGKAPMSTKIKRTKAPKRAPATTGVNLNMGAPQTRRTTARGMGAALRGGNFTENT